MSENSRVAISGNQYFSLVATSGLLAEGYVITPFPSEEIRRGIIDSSFDLIISDSQLSGMKLATLNYQKPGKTTNPKLAKLTDFMALAVFTSGSTGTPKLMQLSLTQLLDRLKEHHRSLNRAWKVMNFFPVFSVVGSYSFLDSIFHGKTYVALGEIDFTINQLARWKKNAIISSPAAIAEFIRLAQGKSIPMVKTVILTGGPVSQAFEEKVQQFFGCQVITHYGSTETGKVSATDPRGRSSEMDQGRLLDNVVVEIVDDQDRQVSEGEFGYVRIKTPTTVSGYIENAEATNRSFRDGFFYTGDSGRLVPGRRLQISGRSDFVANLGGIKISLEEIEKFCEATHSIQALAFTYQASEQTKLGLGLVGQVDRAAIESSLRFKFGKKAPNLFIQIPAIPLTDTGKPDRQLLARRVEENRLT